MRIVASIAITALLCLIQGTQALQMILSTRDPQCLTIQPVRVGVNIDISYTISGVNE